MKVVGVKIGVLYILGFFASVQCSVFSNFRNAARFTLCLERELDRSLVFTTDEKESISEVNSMMLRAMRNIASRMRSDSVKVTTIAFTTSVANIVVMGEPDKYTERKNAYMSALEKCTIVSTGFIDNNFIREAEEILERLEQERTTEQKFENENAAESTSETITSLSIPQTKETSVIVMEPITSLDTTTEQASTEDYVATKTSDFTLNVTANTPQNTETSFMHVPTSTYNADNSTSDFSTSLDGIFFNSPQNTETSFTHVPTSTYNTENSTSDFSSSLEGIIFDLLVNSFSFKNAFSSIVDKHKAIYLARLLTTKSLSGFDQNIINEALEAVSGAVGSVTVYQPENFALAISNALGSVLRAHDLSLFAGAQLASSIVSNVDNETKALINGADNSDNYTESLGITETDVEEEHTHIDFLFPVLEPEDVEGEIFSYALQQFLSNSEIINNLFCGEQSSLEISQMFFDVVRYSLAEYGIETSSVSATYITSSLSLMSKELQCTMYSRVISDTIAEVLEENGLIQNVDAEVIANKMEISLRDKISVVDTQIEKQPVPTSTDSERINGNYSYQNASESITSSHTVEDQKQDFKSLQDDQVFNTEHTISISGSGEATHNSQVVGTEAFLNKNETDSKKITTEHYEIEQIEVSEGVQHETLNSETESSETSSTNLTNEFSSVLVSHPTEKPPISSTKNPIADKIQLAHMLFDEMYSVLEAINDTTIDSTESKTQPNQRHETTAINEQFPFKSYTPQLNLEGSKMTTTDRSVLNKFTAGEDGYFLGSNYPNAVPVTTPLNIYEFPVATTEELIDTTVGKNSYSPATTMPPFDDTYEITEFIPSNVDEISTINLDSSFREPEAFFTSAPTTLIDQKGDRISEENLAIVKKVSEITAASIEIIRRKDFDLYQLCDNLNNLAEIVSLPRIAYCNQFLLVDFLLHALSKTTQFIIKDS